MLNVWRRRGNRGLAALIGFAAASLARAFTWETADPAAQGIDAGLLDTMSARIETDPRFQYVTSLLVIRHGKIAYEGYFQGTQAGDLRNMHSVTKAFTSLATGIAIERGLMPSLDTKIRALYPELTPATSSTFLDNMKLRHVLAMAAGHADESYNAVADSPNWAQAFLDYPMAYEPGTHFVYDNGGPFLISAAIQKFSGLTLEQFVANNLFGPLGITNHEWLYDSNGRTNGATGLRLSTRDLGKLGLLCLQRGKWDGAQIVPEAYVDAAGSKQVETGEPKGGFWDSGYGYYFWLNQFGGYRADGAYGQLAIVLPELDAVAVLTSKSIGVGYGLLPTVALVQDYVVPSIRAATGSASAPRLTAMPTATRAEVGAPARFAVTATGTDLNYHWYRGDEVLEGENKRELVLPVSTATDAANYSVVVSNRAGAVRSAAVALTVEQPGASLTISAAPAPRTVVNWGQSVTLGVTASSTSGALTYQWSHNNRIIPGATRAQLTLTAAGRGDAGSYDVLVSNSVTSRRTPVGFVTVSVPRARVVTWGPNVEASIPTELTDVVAITPLAGPAAETKGCILHADGLVTFWGAVAPVAGLREVVAVSRGHYTCFVLIADGTALGWSSGLSQFYGIGLTNGVAVAAGYTCGFVLKRNGTVEPWEGYYTDVHPAMRHGAFLAVGDSTDDRPYDHLAIAVNDDGTASYADMTTTGNQQWHLSLSTDLTAVAVGYNHVLALKENHTAEAWYLSGYVDHGQGTVPADLNRVIAVSAYRNTNLALRDDRTVVAWGESSTGLTTIPTGLSKIVSIDASGIALCDLSGVPWFDHELLDDQTVNAGANVVFTAQASDTPTYQWQESTDGSTWNNLSEQGGYTGTASNRLTLGLVGSSLNGRFYRCIATNLHGAAKTSAAKLTVVGTYVPPTTPTTPTTPSTPSSGGGGGGGALEGWLVAALGALALVGSVGRRK